MRSQTDLLTRSYLTLGLTPKATYDQVKEAYRDLVQVWHPDRFSHNERLRVQSEQKLREINDAYEVLERYFSEGLTPPKEEADWTSNLRAHLIDFYSITPSVRSIAVGLGFICLLWFLASMRIRSRDELSLIQGDWIYTRQSMTYAIDKIILKINGKKVEWTVFYANGNQPMSTEADIVRIEPRQDGTKLAIIGNYNQKTNSYETMNVGLFLMGDDMEVALLTEGKTPDQATIDDIWRFHRTKP